MSRILAQYLGWQKSTLVNLIVLSIPDTDDRKHFCNQQPLESNFSTQNILHKPFHFCPSN